MPATIETYQMCGSLLTLGANGGQPREWLAYEHQGAVRHEATIHIAAINEWL